MRPAKSHSDAHPDVHQRPRGRSRGLRKYHVLLAVLAILLAFMLFHGGRARENMGTVHWEDMDFIRHNAHIVHSLTDCFTERPLWPGLYRPLTTNLYYYLGRVLFSNRIEVHHGINIALYLINALLLYLICLRLLPSWWALLPPVLLVSRISHVEVVLNTCEVQTLLSVFFTLLALLLFMSARIGSRGYCYFLSLLAYALALLSKETALPFPVILLAYGVLYDERRAWRHYVPPAAVAVLWVVLYLAVFRSVSDHEPTGFNYRAGAGHLLEGYAAYVLTFINLLTYRLENVAMVESVGRPAGSAAAKVLSGAGAALCAAYYLVRGRVVGRHRRRYDAIAFGFAFCLIALSPYVILESRLFMRYGYAGHAGLAIAAGALTYHIVSEVRSRTAKEGTHAGTEKS